MEAIFKSLFLRGDFLPVVVFYLLAFGVVSKGLNRQRPFHRVKIGVRGKILWVSAMGEELFVTWEDGKKEWVKVSQVQVVKD